MYKDERHGLKDYKIENTVVQQKKCFTDTVTDTLKLNSESFSFP